MSKKLLVITAGTVAASVGRNLLKQMDAHLSSELLVKVRYIDTAYLPDRDTTLRPGEWFQLSIDERYMKALYKKREQHPRLERMLFPNLLPGTASTGGGSIRYNGAGAIEVKRENLRSWLSGCMIDLARDGDGSTNVSVALIVSAVGATGSGSLEHLIDVIVDAAHFAGIQTTDQGTIRCDTYILQPSQDVTDLGLANTLALYAELAASQLDGGGTRAYQGRKVLIGWGSTRALGSIEQLQEAAATIVRLSSDPSSSFAAEFREREVDNHILRELDPMTNLPMHLSLATVVTISMGRLEEQVIQRDVTRLVNSLVFDTTGSSSGSDNVLLGRFADALAGEDAESRYHKLLDYLAEPVRLAEKYQNIDKTLNARGTPDSEKGPKLMSIWRQASADVSQSRHRINDFASTFAAHAQLELDRVKGERICKGNVSLTELREEYRSLQNVLQGVLDVARQDTSTSVNDGLVTRESKALEGFWLVSANRKTKLRQLASAIQRNLQEHLQENTRSSAITVLEKLEQRCAELGRNLDIVLNKLRRKRDDDIRFATSSSKFAIDSGNPMNIVALSEFDEITAYANQVSVFTSQENAPEQLSEFRQWLQGRPELEALFKGNLDQLMGVISIYTRSKVREAMEKHSVLDVLHRTGEDSLSKRLKEASIQATALVRFSKDFSPGYREAWHVSAFCRNGDQREELQDAMKEAFPQGQCKLLHSNDPAEIAIFYYVDGIPMSAVDDLKGRCLEAFLKRRKQWQQHKKVLANASRPVDSIGYLNQRVGVPIFSGKDAEDRILRTGVLQRLYESKGDEVSNYNLDDLPELQTQKTPDSATMNGAESDASNHNGKDGITIAPAATELESAAGNGTGTETTVRKNGTAPDAQKSLQTQPLDGDDPQQRQLVGGNDPDVKP